MHVLVAEDDDHTRAGLLEILAREGYQTSEACNGEEALAAVEAGAPDFVCLDVMMPRVSGFDVCRQLRAKGNDVPIIFISAKSEEVDRVVGLELGADDFIVKPFGVREVIARIRSVSRRCLARRPERDAPFELADLRVDPEQLRAFRGEEAIDLSLRDVKLLRLFADHPGKVLSRDQLAQAGWDSAHFPLSRTLDQHISQLRKRIELDPKHPAIIRTVHGAGYRFDP